MLGILVSFWNTIFSGAMLVLGRVEFWSLFSSFGGGLPRSYETMHWDLLGWWGPWFRPHQTLFVSAEFGGCPYCFQRGLWDQSYGPPGSCPFDFCDPPTKGTRFWFATNLGVFGCATNFTTRWAFSGLHVPIREFFHDRRVRECSKSLCNELTGLFPKNYRESVTFKFWSQRCGRFISTTTDILFSFSFLCLSWSTTTPNFKVISETMKSLLLDIKHLSPKNNSTELQGDNEWFMIDF